MSPRGSGAGAASGAAPPGGLGDRSLAALDWPELLARLAAETRSARGADACRALVAGDDPALARERSGLVSEMVAILRGGAEPPGLAFPEIGPALAAVERGEVLSADELRPVAVACGVAEGAQRFFAAGAAAGAPTPGLSAIASQLDPRDDIADAIRGTFDEAGNIRDSASVELARLRHERDLVSARVREVVERLLGSEEWEPYLQDRFVTIRSDRFVLPLRASAKSMGFGIVHDTSRTGETVFVEPTVAVELNNRLKVAELETERECRRILEALAAEIAAAAPALRATIDVLTRLDVLAAMARLARASGAEPIALVDEAVVDLRQLRHPLLALRAEGERFPVVANDVELGGTAAKLLVVSGPNAGGKTVLLKAVGLAALMARTGMHVPAGRGSRIGSFDPVLAEIGDWQSVLGDLSTFSGHLGALAQILRAAAEPGARPLVLLDELMAGTNPEQGGALARATLERLGELPVVGLATTHYDALKALGESNPGFGNAGMEYDLPRLAPTFRLRPGAPGRSFAFEIAERMGLPEALVARARALGGAASGLERILASLEEREAGLTREADALERARTDVEEAADAGRAAAEALERRERELGLHAREAVEEAVREAREALRAIVREAQRAGTPRAADAARVAVDDAARAAVEKLPQKPTGDAAEAPARPAALRVGDSVFVPSLRKAGLVAQAPDARGRTKVTIGALTVEVDAAELGAATGFNRGEARKAAAAARSPSGSGSSSSHASDAGVDDDGKLFGIPTPATTLDLRGTRVDDAVGAVEAFLDRAALEHRSPVFIIHGHGTGALRKEVRAYLAKSPYVKRWSPGSRNQGGDGVSVIEL